MTDAQRAEIVRLLIARREAVQAFLDMPGKIQAYKSHCPTVKTVLQLNDNLTAVIAPALYSELVTIERELSKLQL